MSCSTFKEDHSFAKRKAEADRIRQKYTDRIPIICDRAHGSDITKIDKSKYLVPADLTVGQFVFVIRKRIQLSHEKALFLFVQDELAPTSALLSQVYEQHRDEDGFLYITYSGESTFGVGLTDLPFEIFDYIDEVLEPQSKIRLALTCRSLLAAVYSSRSLPHQFRYYLKEFADCTPDLGRPEASPRWQVLRTARWDLLEDLEDSRWKCCSTCLKLHPVGHFPDDQIAKPPKERYCRLGNFNGLVSLCECKFFSFLDKKALIDDLRASGGQYTSAQTWHKCKKLLASTPSSSEMHIQLRPQLGPQGQLRIETTYKLTAAKPNEPLGHVQELLTTRFACPHCTIFSFMTQSHPVRIVPRNMTYHFGHILDSSGNRTVWLNAREFMTCTKCQTTIIDYGALGPDAGEKSYFRTVRDLGGSVDRPDQTWYRQTSTSLEALEAQEEVGRYRCS